MGQSPDQTLGHTCLLGYALSIMKRVPKSSSDSSVRVIAGRLRGRRVRFSAPGIRPTGDRIRETLFNWLSGRIAETRCLDLFAGSGILGIEALSRGAASAVFVEQDRHAARELQANLVALDVADGRVICADAWQLPLASAGPFHVVFLDPPFDSPRIPDLCKLLESSSCLAETALIYTEVPKQSSLPELPPGWQVLRENTAGQVRYALLQRQGASS